MNIKDELKVNGFFHTSFEWDLPIKEMAEHISDLKKSGKRPVNCFMRDEFWQLTVRLDPLIKSILGPNYRRLSELWAWHVDPAQNERGWKIHRDKDIRTLHKDGSPKSITIWIPLTDTNEENGCMYVVPINKDPDYHLDLDQTNLYGDNVAQPLPAKAGDVLGWTQALLHWGGKPTNPNAPPRISVSYEFAQTDAGSFRKDTETFDPFYIPSEEEKEAIIKKQVKKYHHMWVS